MSGPMVVTNQKEEVNVSEVDSIGGAKPEPEERPLNITLEIEKGTGEGAQQPGAAELQLDRNKLVTVESSVAEREQLLGKYCGNCLHFNHAAGLATLERWAHRGTDAEKKHLQALYGELAEEDPTGGGEDVVTTEEVFQATYAERRMGQMGRCQKASNLLSEDVLVMPDGHCMGPGEPLVQNTDLWEAKDRDVARHVAEQREALYGAATSGPVK
ncbi:MAG: hypothetical protein KA310_03370 [Pseudomonadales bacterium]|nr:hypothetical protein [Pseudomonadales bacterium]